MKEKHLAYLLAGLTALFTFVVYLPSLQNEFVDWDDYIYVLENTHIRSMDWAFFKWAFISFHASNWHPLTWISHAIDYAVWGLNPAGHHLTNNMLHGLNTFLVVLLIIRIVEAARERSSKYFIANRADRTALIAGGVTGLLFGIHPIHVESVAWVSERKDLLCAFFFLLSAMMYGSYFMSGTAGRNTASRFLSREYLMSVGLFLLALMSKPMAVSLPVVLLILDWYPFQRIRSLKSGWSALLDKTPFIALSLFSSVMTILAQKHSMGLMEFVSLQTKILVAAKSLVMYLWKVVFPLSLSAFYLYPEHVSLLSPEYLFPVLLVAGITLTCVAFTRAKKVWLAIWGYYIVTLLPVIGIVQVGYQSMADRYMYLPGIGPFLVIGLFIVWVKAKTDVLSGSRMIKLAGVFVAFTFLVLFSHLTIKQITVWENTVTFYSYVINKSPRELPIAYYNRGMAYSERGETDRAIADFEELVEMDPGDYEVHTRLGVLYAQSGFLSKAIASFNKAIEMNPDYPFAYGNRGYAYSLLGKKEKAIKDLSRAIALDKGYVKAYVNRGNLYLSSGREELAARDFQEACDMGDGEACSTSRALQSRLQGQ